MTSETERNRAAVQRIYDAANQGDLAAVAAGFHPDIVLRQPASLPYGGEFVGREAAMATIVRMFTEHYEVSRLELTHLAVDADLVISAATLHATARPTGRAVVMPFRECFTMRHGLAVELTPFYFDTAALAAAFAP